MKKLKKILTYVPDTLIIVIIGILLAKFLDLEERGVLLLGANSAGKLIYKIN